MLNPKIFDKDVEQIPVRDGYGRGLVAIGEKNPQVVILCADVTESTRCHWFKEKFPERYIELGVAEQNMATIASGLANYGKIPFITTYGVFNPGRNLEQIRTTICISNLPVKVCGSHAGVSVGPDGATHQALEDIALMRTLPNMTVISPCDALETEKAVAAAVAWPGPVYIRVSREKSPVITTKDAPFQIGKAEVLRDGQDATIVACGILLYNALTAAEELSKEGLKIRIINNHTIKPIDKETLIAAAKETRAIVTLEEHQVAGGLGSAVAEVLAENYPVPIEFMGIRDKFGESGKPKELIEHYELGIDEIKKVVKKAITRKE